MHTMKITCSFSSFIRIMVLALLSIIAMGFWIYAEIKFYETKVEQKWMNYYYEKLIESQKENLLHKPTNKDEWNEYR